MERASEPLDGLPTTFPNKAGRQQHPLRARMPSDQGRARLTRGPIRGPNGGPNGKAAPEQSWTVVDCAGGERAGQ